MGLKYDAHPVQTCGNRLNNSQKAFKRYLIRDMEKLARLVGASQPIQWPHWKPDLWRQPSLPVIKEGYSGLRIELSVSGAKTTSGHPGVEVGDYTKYMELGKYRLGYLSRMKNVTNPPIAGVKPVLGHFLERAVEISEKQFSEAILEAARKTGILREVNVFIEAFASLMQKAKIGTVGTDIFLSLLACQCEIWRPAY